MSTLLTVFLWIMSGVFSLLFLVVLGFVALMIHVVRHDKKQTQHSILRNFPGVGWIRYLCEHFSPELRQYFFEGDHEGTPFSRLDFQSIAKAAKYAKTIIAFGSQRVFDKAGYFIRNALFPKQISELEADNNELIETKTYKIEKDTLFKRHEKLYDNKLKPWLLTDADAVTIGEETCKYPFTTKSKIGMSGMSYGALGENAITALSIGIGYAKAFMNTGEGGLSPHHLKGDADIICQIGPGKFGFRHLDGSFSFEELKKKAEIPQVKAFELKLGQGAKIRGGHIEGAKVTPEIAEIRGVEPWKTIDSPNRFDEFYDSLSLLQFVTKIRETAEKPVGIKVVIGDVDSLEELAKTMRQTGMHPDFITVDGGEGGTGATYKAMADSVGLPIKPALMIVDETLKKYGLRKKIKIIASGKLFSPDRIAIALAMGADLVAIARGMMISVGCIGAQKCHSNDCPVGVATTNPKLQKALVIDEKKYRVANYILTMREELFTLAAASGVTSPAKFEEKHVIFKTENDELMRLSDMKKKYRYIDSK